MFVEDVILGGLKAGSSWFVSDHLLRGDAKIGVPTMWRGRLPTVTIYATEEGVESVRFWRIEELL